MTYFSNCTSIANLEQLPVITCVCACGGENSLQIRAFVWGERKPLSDCGACLHVCVCLLKLRSQPTVEASRVWLFINTEQCIMDLYKIF